MALTPARWLVDRSVLSRLDVEEVARVVLPRMRAGQVGVCLVTELEVGWSARSVRDHAATRSELLDHLIPVPSPARAEQRARDLQQLLVARGQHRAVGVPDLLVAAIADVEDLTVLHYDADFDLVAQVTGQDTEWVVARGSVD